MLLLIGIICLDSCKHLGLFACGLYVQASVPICWFEQHKMQVCKKIQNKSLKRRLLRQEILAALVSPSIHQEFDWIRLNFMLVRLPGVFDLK